MRQHVYTGTAWEPKVAYARAVRVGNAIAVSGTVAVDERGQAVARGDLYAQAAYAIDKIRRALEEVGSGLHDVVRTRTFLTDISRFDEFARAHQEAFAGIDPAATCVEVARLVGADYLIEIEADAIVSP